MLKLLRFLPLLLLPPMAHADLCANSVTHAWETCTASSSIGVLGPVPGNTIIANLTGGTAAPSAFVVTSSAAVGNMALTIGSYAPNNGQSQNLYNSAFGIGALSTATNSQNNTAFGYQALNVLSDGSDETAFGKLALRDDVSGQFNFAAGSAAMRCFTGTGSKIGNTALGHGALAGDDTLCGTIPGGSPGTYAGVTAIGGWVMQELTTGTFDTGVGESNMLNLSTGIDNTSVGAYAGPCADTTFDTSGRACAGASNNTALGFHALRMSSANSNTAVGYEALGANVAGIANTAVGFNALSTAAGANDNGNTAVGFAALSVANGSATGSNTGVGNSAGKLMTTASLNTYLGSNAGATQTVGNSNTGIGAAALTAYTGASGGGNTAVGDHAGAAVTSGFSNTIIGSNVASTTLQSGVGNILIGVSSTTDTAGAATSNTLAIQGVSPGVAAITATALNTSTPPVAMPGALTVTGQLTGAGTTAGTAAAAGVIGQVASIHCVVGTQAAAATSVTITIASPGVVTWTSHTFVPSSGLANYACPINFTGTPPTGISVGTNYYIIGSTVSGDTFQISDTAAHALAGTNAVNTSGSDGGTSAYIGALGANGTVFTGAALQLVAGDWDCTDLGEFQELTTLTTQRFATGVSTSGATFGSIGTFTDNRTVSGAIGAVNTYLPSPVVQQNISATTGVHAIVSASFTVGTMNEGAFLRCRRMR